MGVYPPQPYTLDLTTLPTHQVARVNAIPLRYDATSDDATLYKQMTVQITYQAPNPIAITRFGAGQPIYAPGETPDITAMIANVGDTAAELTGELRIEDAGGANVGATSVAPLTLPGGTSVPLALSWAGGLGEGEYVTRLALKLGQELVAEAAAPFAVRSGGIVDLAGPALVMPGEGARFYLRFRNGWPEAVEAVVSVSIYNGRGEPVAHLPSQSLNAGAGGEASAAFAWNPGAAGGAYRAEAIAAVGGHVYGPVIHPFVLGHRINLPVVLRNR